MCADDPEYDVEKLDKHGRRDVRAGLRRCHVERVNAEWVSENGYEVFASAYDRYEGESRPPEPNHSSNRPVFATTAGLSGSSTPSRSRANTL